MAFNGKVASPGIAKLVTAKVLNCLTASPCDGDLASLPKHSDINKIR